MDMIWDNPPDRGKKLTKWAIVAAKLQENPGKWAKLKEAPKVRNAHGLAGRLRTKFGPDYEVIARSIGEDGGGGVWARYYPDFMVEETVETQPETPIVSPVPTLETSDPYGHDDGGGAGIV